MRRCCNYLYKYSDLQVTFGVNMVAIAGGKPRAAGRSSRCIGYYIAPPEERGHRAARSYELDAGRGPARTSWKA